VVGKQQSWLQLCFRPVTHDERIRAVGSRQEWGVRPELSEVGANLPPQLQASSKDDSGASELLTLAGLKVLLCRIWLDLFEKYMGQNPAHREPLPHVVVFSVLCSELDLGSVLGMTAT